MDRKGSQGATALLGLAGFVVLAAIEADGEAWQLVETTATAAGCPGCGARARSKGRRRVVVRDLPAGGRPVVVVWAKRRWRCPEPACPQGSWSETSPAVAPRASLTERARAEAARRVGQDASAVAPVARDLGVGWHTVMAGVRDHGRPLVDDPDRLGEVGALGLDETAFLAATPAHPTTFVTGFVDLEHHRLLDVVPGRSAEAVRTWLGARPPVWRDGVEAVALDPHRGYARGLVDHLGHATVVVDHFHVVALANRAIDDVRRRVQQDTTGHRGRKGDPLYGVRRTLLRGAERLGTRGWEKLLAGLEAGDPHGEVAAAWLAKEELRLVYRAVDAPHARRRLIAFYRRCADAGVPEVVRLAKTVSAWQDEVLAYHTTKLSNGPTEAVNLLVKKVKRVGHGFRNFENYRLRLLLHCGVEWDTAPTARIRGRRPPLVA